MVSLQFSFCSLQESYSDVTIACDGKFYPLHKLVLSTCSEYFEEMFEKTSCKNPVIVLKDIQYEEFEALLNYMYIGEVNVLQEKLSGLIRAAECLKIKGLAVPDESPSDDEKSAPPRRIERTRYSESPKPKRRKRESVHDSEDVFVPKIVKSKEFKPPVSSSQRTSTNESESVDNIISNSDSNNVVPKIEDSSEVS